MALFTYPGALVNWITTINAILLLSSLVSVYCSNPPITLDNEHKWVTLFPAAVQDKALEIYNHVPGTTIKFLNLKSITKKAECSEADLTIRSSTESYNAECNEIRKILDDSMNKKKAARGIGKEYDEGFKNLRYYLRKSLMKMFDGKNF
ncbi:hypothetical protein I4U23_016901 [Adineta vaga]|nr:hypothetical protein I4U23_016901 [Adineta vaga]